MAAAPTADDIARCVLDAYDRLPQKCKPLEREPGSREWVPLSGIVLATGSGSLECVALGTGMKCLPASKLAVAHGNVLHDSHAEILAARAFNRFLLDQCYALALDRSMESPYLRWRGSQDGSEEWSQPFTIREDVTIHMYGSEAPCGDASMELIMAAQNDATPWEVSATEDILKGRGSFAELGIVRRKPARPDAPITYSKSCTDKLAMYQFTSVLDSLTSLLVSLENAYVSTFTLPESQYVPAAFARAFSSEGRLRPAVSDLKIVYRFRSFAAQTTSLEFAWSRRGGVYGDCRVVPSNVSAVYTPNFQETLINGVLQGRKMGDPKGASKICRRQLWSRCLDIARALNDQRTLNELHSKTYEQVKDSRHLAARRDTKHFVRQTALKGWTRNIGDEQFGLDC